MLRQYVKGKSTGWLLMASLAALLSGCAGCPGENNAIRGNNARRMFFDRQTGLVATEPSFPMVYLRFPSGEASIMDGIAAPRFFAGPKRQKHLHLCPEKNARIRNFLVKQGYFEVERPRFSATQFFHSTDKLKEHLEMVEDPWLGKTPLIKLAKRALRSIDYSHQFEEGGATHWAITFSYTIRPTLSGLPRVNKVFEGGAEAFLNPRTGRWELVELNLPLELRDFSEALEIIKLLPSP